METGNDGIFQCVRTLLVCRLWTVYIPYYFKKVYKRTYLW
jgi:hypothetical protein